MSLIQFCSSTANWAGRHQSFAHFVAVLFVVFGSISTDAIAQENCIVANEQIRFGKVSIRDVSGAGTRSARVQFECFNLKRVVTGVRFYGVHPAEDKLFYWGGYGSPGRLSIRVSDAEVDGRRVAIFDAKTGVDANYLDLSDSDTSIYFRLPDSAPLKVSSRVSFVVSTKPSIPDGSVVSGQTNMAAKLRMQLLD